MIRKIMYWLFVYTNDVKSIVFAVSIKFCDDYQFLKNRVKTLLRCAFREKSILFRLLFFSSIYMLNSEFEKNILSVCNCVFKSGLTDL